METHIHVEHDTGKKFYLKYLDKGKIVMLNLLKFKATADYSNLEHLQAEEQMSGAQAYHLYMKHTSALFKDAGSRLIYFGESSDFLIGPESEKWDAVLLVEHASVKKFMALAESQEYLKVAGHRTAALEDSRLLPSGEITFSRPKV